MSGDFSEYLELDGVNWSTLKELRRSPLHYQHRKGNAREDTATLRRGRSIHSAVFEPDRFALEYAVFKGKTRRGKAWDAFLAAHPDETILRVPEYKLCIAARDAVRSHPLAKPYLERGQAEQSISWRDPETGLTCKARLDFISESKPALVELKSTASISYKMFANTAYRMGYHCQTGFYRDGLALARGKTLTVVVIAVEDKPPHDVGVFEYSEEALYAGAHEVKSLLTRLQFHRERDVWPGTYAEEQFLELPAWATPDENDDVNDLGLEA